TEGSCPNPGIPSNGGTIMSYCHLRSTGINFFNGFGPQPTAVIQNRVAAAQGCVQAVCSVVGDGDDDDDDDPDDPSTGGDDEISCEEQTVYLDLTLDDFGMETTWSLRTEAGGLIAKGGPYAKKQKGKVIKDTICIPDGCYVFEIKDSDFDGICCDYGNGSFSLRDSSGNVLGGNNTFDTLAIVDFCLPDVPPDDNEECAALNFIEEPVLPYGTNQDAGTFAILENGNTLLVEGNAWKKIDLDYTITSDTWLSFWFRSTQQGEVHGIGFDDNDIISSNLTFKLYGTQNWGRQEFTDYPGNGRWKFYQIPVGNFYVGDANTLFFIADHDVGARNGNSYFRSVTISEGMPCRPERTPIGRDLPAEAQNVDLQLHPNPANERVRVTLNKPASEAAYRVVDLNGRTLRQGQFKGEALDLQVRDLPTGTYVFHYNDGTGRLSRRFTVTK
ncbi:MAG: T9SS type A sorting domain-containing protein, partial [Bacteroidota bacterium]